MNGNLGGCKREESIWYLEFIVYLKYYNFVYFLEIFMVKYFIFESVLLVVLDISMFVWRGNII